MTQWEEIRRRPVLPFYLAALVWRWRGCCCRCTSCGRWR